MSQQDNINESYKRIAAGYYDSILSTKRLWSKVLYMIIWGYSTTVYTQTVLELLPDDFAGKLLDIPVGTGLFTEKKYFKMKTAELL